MIWIKNTQLIQALKICINVLQICNKCTDNMQYVLKICNTYNVCVYMYITCIHMGWMHPPPHPPPANIQQHHLVMNYMECSWAGFLSYSCYVGSCSTSNSTRSREGFMAGVKATLYRFTKLFQISCSHRWAFNQLKRLLVKFCINC